MSKKKRNRHWLLKIVDAYKADTSQKIVETSSVIAWARARGFLDQAEIDVDAMLREKTSALLRGETTRFKGKDVRVNHCVTVSEAQPNGATVQRTLWGHIDDAPLEHIVESLVQRWTAIGADVESFRADLDLLNHRQVMQGKEPLQMNFDFGPKE